MHRNPNTSQGTTSNYPAEGAAAAITISEMKTEPKINRELHEV